MQDDVFPTAIGLLRCLQMLVEEAATLGLTRTNAALQDAIAVCRREAGLPIKMLGQLDTARLLH